MKLKTTIKANDFWGMIFGELILANDFGRMIFIDSLLLSQLNDSRAHFTNVQK